jgi:hypothetical protein
MSIDTYRDGIQRAYIGEIIGESLYRNLASRASEADQIFKLQAIANVEQITHQRLKAVADRLEIRAEEAGWRRVVGRRTRELTLISWGDFIDLALRDWPPYIALFESLQELAPAIDATAIQFLVRHEVVLVDFVRIEKKALGSQVSLQVLQAFLNES